MIPYIETTNQSSICPHFMPVPRYFFAKAHVHEKQGSTQATQHLFLCSQEDIRKRKGNMNMIEVDEMVYPPHPKWKDAIRTFEHDSCFRF